MEQVSGCETWVAAKSETGREEAPSSATGAWLLGAPLSGTGPGAASGSGHGPGPGSRPGTRAEDGQGTEPEPGPETGPRPGTRAEDGPGPGAEVELGSAAALVPVTEPEPGCGLVMNDGLVPWSEARPPAAVWSRSEMVSDPTGEDSTRDAAVHGAPAVPPPGAQAGAAVAGSGGDCCLLLEATAAAPGAFGALLLRQVTANRNEIGVVAAGLPLPVSLGPRFTRYVLWLFGGGSLRLGLPLGAAGAPVGPLYAGGVGPLPTMPLSELAISAEPPASTSLTGPVVLEGSFAFCR